MDTRSLFCIYCGKKIMYDAAKPPRFCLYCGEEIVIPKKNRPEAVNDNMPAQQTASEQDTVRNYDENSLIELTQSETAAQQSNTDFFSSEKEKIFTGWLPESFTGYAKYEPSFQTPDFPLLLWAFAKNGSGSEYFCRKEKIRSINKLDPNAENPFRLFDAYLDENAAALLGTKALRLVKRVPAFQESQQKLYDILMKRKQQIESRSQGNFIQYVVQGEYGAEGGKLYEAEIGGRKKYLLLYTVMIADEYGAFSPSLLQSQARTNQMLQSMRTMGRLPFFQMPQQQGMPVIDTDPNTQFGCHRTDGFTTNMITWLIPAFAGFLSDSLPDKEAVCDFYKFLNSLKVAPETEQQINRLREQIMVRQMADQQQAANIMQQMVRDQQRSFDRRSEIMRDLNEHRDNLFQQRIAADNAAFDRRSRLQHESIMGVNTYTRTDGTNIEADVRFDRVFQRENDPTQLIGAPNTADVPFGWTELEKLK